MVPLGLTGPQLTVMTPNRFMAAKNNKSGP